jgi:hypothetical protein
MIPSLFTATLLTGLVLLAIGLPFAINHPGWESRARAFPRSISAAILLMGGGGLWFLYNVAHLGQSDFGDYKKLLLALFGGALIGSFFFLRDFLAVRGAAVLTLVAANDFLKSAYALYDIPQRLVLVTVLYVLVVIAIYLGTVPFRLRDFFGWLFVNRSRPRALGAIVSLSGLALLATAVSY